VVSNAHGEPEDGQRGFHAAAVGREAIRRNARLRTGHVHQAGAEDEVRLGALPVQIEQAIPRGMDAAGLEWRVEGTVIARGSERVHFRFQTEPARQAVSKSAAGEEQSRNRE